MLRRPTKEINAEFPAEERYLDSIQQIVREACAVAGMKRKQATAVQLAVEEGATNIIRHAYLYEKGTIRVRIVIYRRMMVFSLIDTGRSFQPDSTGKLDLDRLVESGRRGGLGFYMVQKIMDSVEYISSAGYNELRMSKRIHGSVEKSKTMLRRMASLRVKFSFWTLFIVSIIVVAVFYYENTVAVKELYTHLDATARALGTTIADQGAGYVINRRSDVEFDRLTVSYKKSNPFIELIVITDTAGIVLAHSEDIHHIRKPYVPPLNVPPGDFGVPRRIPGSTGNLSYLTVPMTDRGVNYGQVHLMYSSELIDANLHEARTRSIILTAALLLVGIIGIYLLSSYFVTPIVRITSRVRKFTSGEMGAELPLDGADEFLEISRAFNEMMTRLSQDRKNVVEREKMAKEIEVASQIQKTLLPRDLPEIPGFEVDSFYRAASMVGGDLFDLFHVGDQRFAMVVADVSGKGVPASLVMSMLRTVIQIYSRQAVSPRDVLIKVNDYLRANIPPGMFITVLMAIVDASVGRIKLVSAGHNPLLHFQNGTSQVMRINPPGMPMGVPDTLGRTFEESLQEVEFDLMDHDCVLLYTDGITEATNREGRQFGIGHLAEVLREELTGETVLSVRDLTRRLVDELDAYSGFSKQSDDVTFILARVVPRAVETDDGADENAIQVRRLAEESGDNQP